MFSLLSLLARIFSGSSLHRAPVLCSYRFIQMMYCLSPTMCVRVHTHTHTYTHIHTHTLSLSYICIYMCICIQTRARAGSREGHAHSNTGLPKYSPHPSLPSQYPHPRTPMPRPTQRCSCKRLASTVPLDSRLPKLDRKGVSRIYTLQRLY